MKILALNGSYRTNGNTAQILGLIEEQMRQVADQVDETLVYKIVNLGHLNLQMCRGCRICFTKGEDHCPLKDDLLAVKSEIKDADAVILASPVYVDDVSGITKTFMDRLAHVGHRPEFFGKYAYLLATSGGRSTAHTLRTMIVLREWGFQIMGQTGLKMGALSTREEINARYGDQIEKIAHTLFQAVYQKRPPSFFSFIVFRIQQLGWGKENPKSIDFQYWERKGWLDPRQIYYSKDNANWVTRTVVRLVGSLLALFFI